MQGMVMMAFDVSDPRHGAYNAPAVGILGRLGYSFLKMLIGVFCNPNVYTDIHDAVTLY